MSLSTEIEVRLAEAKERGESLSQSVAKPLLSHLEQDPETQAARSEGRTTSRGRQVDDLFKTLYQIAFPDNGNATGIVELIPPGQALDYKATKASLENKRPFGVPEWPLRNSAGQTWNEPGKLPGLSPAPPAKGSA